MKTIKGKLLLIIPLLMVAIGIIIYSTVPGNWIARAWEYRQQGEYEQAIAYYERMSTFFPSTKYGERAIYEAANMLAGPNLDEHSGIFIFPQSTLTIGDTNNQFHDTGKAIERYKILIQRYPSSIWAGWGRVRLAEIYNHLGNQDESEKWYREAIKYGDPPQGKATLDLAGILLKNGRPGEALEIIEAYQGRNYKLNLHLLKGDALRDCGNIQEARDIYVRTMEIWEASEKNTSAEVRRKEDREISRQRLQKEIEKRLTALEYYQGEDEPGTGVIIGQVLKGNTPFSEVRVYLAKDQENYETGTCASSDVIDDAIMVMTDKNGEYRFENISPGYYQIVLGL